MFSKSILVVAGLIGGAALTLVAVSRRSSADWGVNSALSQQFEEAQKGDIVRFHNGSVCALTGRPYAVLGGTDDVRSRMFACSLSVGGEVKVRGVGEQYRHVLEVVTPEDDTYGVWAAVYTSQGRGQE